VSGISLICRLSGNCLAESKCLSEFVCQSLWVRATPFAFPARVPLVLPASAPALLFPFWLRKCIIHLGGKREKVPRWVSSYLAHQKQNPPMPDNPRRRIRLWDGYFIKLVLILNTFDCVFSPTHGIKTDWHAHTKQLQRLSIDEVQSKKFWINLTYKYSLFFVIALKLLYHFI